MTEAKPLSAEELANVRRRHAFWSQGTPCDYRTAYSESNQHRARLITTIDAQAAEIARLTAERDEANKWLNFVVDLEHELDCPSFGTDAETQEAVLAAIKKLKAERDELKAAQSRIMPNTYTVEVPEIGNKADPFEGPEVETYYVAW